MLHFLVTLFKENLIPASATDKIVYQAIVIRRFASGQGSIVSKVFSKILFLGHRDWSVINSEEGLPYRSLGDTGTPQILTPDSYAKAVSKLEGTEKAIQAT